MAAISGILLALTARTGPLILRHPKIGKTVQCGSDDTELSAEVAYRRERERIEDYQRRGYRRAWR